MLTNLDQDQHAKLLEDLKEFTGNTYSINDNLELALEEIGANSSPTATDFLGTLIDSPLKFNVSSTQGTSGWTGGFDVEINFDLEVDYGKVDPRTLNTGSTLIHELFHAVTGYRETPDGLMATPVPMSATWTGPTVDFVNDIRTERGLPTRSAYFADPTIFSSKGQVIYFDNVNPKKPAKPYAVKRWYP